jgi:hypothetical protein
VLKRHHGIHFIRRWLTLPLAMVLSISAAMVGAAPSGAAPSPGTQVLRNFDALTTVSENGYWKHLALIGDQYVIFDDWGIYEGPRRIRDKWPFLPAQFTANLDSASVLQNGRAWNYMFVQGTEHVFFHDWGIIEGPRPYVAKWPFLPSTLSNGLDASSMRWHYNVWLHMVTSGEYVANFTDTYYLQSPQLIRNLWPFLPARFHSNLDDISVEWEDCVYSGFRAWGEKVSIYKGDERAVFFSNGAPCQELTTLSSKWPFLNTWRTA